MERRSTGAMVTGIVFAGVSGLNILGCLLVLSQAESVSENALIYDKDFYRSMAIVYGVGAGISAAIAIPLIVYGAPKVPAHEASLTTPDLVVGPTGAQATWRF
jgi:hypothetical protein